MRGSYTRWIAMQCLNDLASRKQTTDAVEIATAKHKEECELRLARIQNGKEPSHMNTPWPSQEKGKPMK